MTGWDRLQLRSVCLEVVCFLCAAVGHVFVLDDFLLVLSQESSNTSRPVFQMCRGSLVWTAAGASADRWRGPWRGMWPGASWPPQSITPRGRTCCSLWLQGLMMAGPELRVSVCMKDQTRVSSSLTNITQEIHQGWSVADIDTFTIEVIAFDSLFCIIVPIPFTKVLFFLSSTLCSITEAVFRSNGGFSFAHVHLFPPLVALLATSNNQFILIRNLLFFCPIYEILFPSDMEWGERHTLQNLPLMTHSLWLQPCDIYGSSIHARTAPLSTC